MAFVTSNQKTKKQKNQKANADVKKMSAMPKKPVVKADSGLEFGYWWVGHKDVVKRLAALTVLIVSGILFLYGIYGLLDYYVISYSENQKLFQSRNVSLNWDNIQQASTPLDIQTESVKVLRSGENYDLVTKVFNPNEKWYIEELTYHFDFGGQATETRTSYILPGEVTYLAELDQEKLGAGARATIVIENIKWNKEPEFATLKEKFFKFEITDVSYIPSRQTGLEGQSPINQVKFTIKNNSPQNFWNIDLIILLNAGTQLRAANVYNLNSLDALEQRDVLINWPGALPAINKVSVIPQINILDPNVYKGFGETIGEQK